MSYCAYCSEYPRNECTSTEEASGCPNCTDPGFYLDYTARQVASWIRSYAAGDQELLDAADLVERKM